MPNRPCLDRCEFGSVFTGPNKPIELCLLSFTFFSLHPPRCNRRHRYRHASAVAVATVVSAVAYAVVATASLYFLMRGLKALEALEVFEVFEAKHQVFSTRSHDRLIA